MVRRRKTIVRRIRKKLAAELSCATKTWPTAKCKWTVGQIIIMKYTMVTILTGTVIF